MSTSEEKQDRFLKNLFKDDALQPPLTDNYTAQVMMMVEAQHARSLARRNTLHWLMTAVLGYVGWGLFIFFLWITGILSKAYEFATSLLAPIIDITGFPILVGVIIYLVLARISFVIFMVYKFQGWRKLL